MDQDEIDAALFAVAVEHAGKAGRRLGEGADHDLRGMTANAASYLAGIDGARQQAEQIEQAKADLIRLIEDATAGARALTDYPADLLGERSFYPAKFRFCPCRPFC